MAIDLGRWFRDRKRQVEGVAAQVNPFDNGKTYSSVVQNTPVQTSTQVNQRSAQPPSNRTSNLINPQKPTWLDNQAFTVSSRPIAQPNFQAPKPNGSLQQEIDKSYGRGLSSLKNRLRDVVDSNTQADRIRRVAQTGLDESYQDQQARLTRDAMSRKDGDNIGAQTSGAFFKEGASFVGKSPSSIAQIQARVASSNNPLVRYGVGAVVPGAQYGLLPGGNKRGEQILRASQGINTTIDNKLQQSGLGDRADHNKWARGAGSVGFQLPALLATGPFGLAGMGSQTAADEANKAEMAGRTNEQALGIGLLQGGASMASEKFGLDRFLPGNGTAATSIKPFLGNMAKRIGTEGAQEAQQQFTQNLISNKTYNPNQGLKEGVFESAVLGGLSGGAMSGAIDLPNVTRNTNIKLSPLDESGFIDVPKQDLIIKNGEGKAMSVEKDPLESLKQEARKYKSAEEFVKAQQRLLHGSRENIDQFDLNHLNATYMHDGLGVNFTDNQDFAKLYSRGKNQWGEINKYDDGKGYVNERFIPGAKELDLTSGKKTIGEVLSYEDFKNLAEKGRDKEWARKNLERDARNWLTGLNDDSRQIAQKVSSMSDDELLKLAYDKLSNKTLKSGDGLPALFRRLVDVYGIKDSDKADVVRQFSKLTGVDYIKTAKSDGSVVYNVLNPDKLKTKQQLTDLYNQAHAEANTKSSNMSDRLSESTDPADIEMRRSLSGKNRPKGAFEIEQNQQMTDEQRLQATGGDIGQAGISSDPEALARAKAKLAEAVKESKAKSTNEQTDPVLKALTDHTGKTYTESQVPVSKLVRRAEFQPRTTKSGIGTENSVFEKGYQEGLVDQPLLVRKNGDSYEVLGGHSRTSGMERRAEAGLPNPESVKARVYENITDAEARAISRSANQGGQYESTLDMAKSISDSLKEGAEPSVQKQNMLKGYTTEDYSMLWDVVGNDTTLKDKVFHGAISQEDMLAISRQARLKNLDADTARAIVSNMDKNGTLTKTVAKNVISMIASKRLKTQMSDAQSGMFDLEVLTTPDATKLASDRAIVEADLKSRINALNKVKKEGISKEAAASLEEVNKSLAQKMHDIEKEVIAKYNADIEAKNAAQASLSIDTKSTADKPSETATPKSTAKLVQSTPIKVQGSTSQKNIPARKLERSGDVVTATNVNPNIKATEKRFSIDDDGNLIEDRKGAYRIFNDGEGKITGVRIGEEYHSAKELGDLSDVNDYGSSLATMRRNIERSFGKETGDKLSKFVVDHQQKQATKLIRRQLELKQGTDALAKELGISFGIGSRRAKKVSASIQDYGEGNITRQDLVSQYGENMAGKIVEADKWFKSQYNQLLDEMNKTLTTYGYDPVPKRKNYYTHFQDQGLWSKVGLKMQEIRSLTSPTTQDSMPAPIRGSIDNRLAGQSEFMTPNKRFNPFALQRKGDAHTSDAFQSFERYLTPTLNNIYMTPSITRARVVSKAVAEQANLAGKDANGVMIQMREWANRLAGKTSRIDRPLVDSKWGNTALRASQWAQRKAGANTIVGNLSTAVMQPVVLTQTTGKFGLKNTLLATVQEMSTAHSKDAPIRQSEFMRRRYADIANTTRGKIDRAADIANTPLKVVEETAARITWNAAHNDALSKGMKGDAAIRYADIQTEKTVSGRSIGERPELFDAKAPGLISMYQLEVNNYWQQVGKEMTKAQAARTMAAGYAFNLLLGAINGRSVGFNPIDAILDSIGMLDDEEEPADKAKRIAQRLSGELIDSLPFTGAVGSTLMGDQRWKDTLGKDSTSGRFGFNNAPRTLIENPGMLITPFGYNQARKTIQGLDTWRKGQLESKSGKKLTDVPQTKTNLAKALAFGKSAIPEVNQYYDSIGKKKTIKSNTGVEGIIAEKARLNEELRNTLSDDDYTIYKMSKADREKVVKAGIKSQSDIDGLDNYVNQQKKRLGIKTEDKTDYYKSNDAEYNSFKKEYDDKIKNNEYTKAGKIKAENKLRKLEVGKPYSKDARDLYDINKSQLAKWLSTDEKGVDKQKLHDELIAYDQALYDAGLIKYKKFKGGVATGRNGKGGSRKGGGKSKIDIAQILSKSNLQVQHSQNLSKLLAGTTFKGTKTKPSTSKNKSKVAQKTIKVDMRA